VIAARELRLRYRTGSRQVTALDGVDVTFGEGMTTAVVGESGSGKSSLVTALLRLLPRGATLSGTITVDGRDITALSERELARSYRWTTVSLVLQGAMNAFTPVLTLGRQIAEVLEIHRGLSRQEALIRSGSLLEETGLPGAWTGRYPHELSGGQKQRAAVAMALACDPLYLLADEPTTALDVITQAEIVILLKSLTKRRGLGLILVTHDLALASAVADRLVVLQEGRVVEEGPTEEILASPGHPHTAALLGALRALEARP
jgi:ABC-type glutathione transport system ATPase component